MRYNSIEDDNNLINARNNWLIFLFNWISARINLIYYTLIQLLRAIIESLPWSIKLKMPIIRFFAFWLANNLSTPFIKPHHCTAVSTGNSRIYLFTGFVNVLPVKLSFLVLTTTNKQWEDKTYNVYLWNIASILHRDTINLDVQCIHFFFYIEQQFT